MKTLPLTSIQISPDRQRREFDPVALNELRDDIEQNGLFHPIVLRDGNYLVSGERRLRAIQDLHGLDIAYHHDSEPVPAGHIPYVTLGDLPPLEAALAEWSENMVRKDLTWQEQAAATAQLAKLRAAVAERDGRAAPTPAEIALERRPDYTPGGAANLARAELLVAPHLHRPEIAAAKSPVEALKILRKEETAAQNVARAAQVGRVAADERHTILNRDSSEWLKECPEGMFDVILTDPPYGMGADEFGDSGEAGRRYGVAEHGYKDDDETFDACHEELVLQAGRITKPQAHIYVFCDLDRFAELREAFGRAGWWVHRTPLIWTKPNALRVPWPEHGPRRSYELILYAVKGKRPVNFIGSDVIEVKQDENIGNPAQKPVALLAELLKRSVRPGDRILDPFAGTGSILPAGHEAGCLVTAVERDQGQFGIMLKRLEGLK